MAATIKDVAKAVGMSVATVSRALNDTTRHKVAPDTYERIKRLAQKYQFLPVHPIGHDPGKRPEKQEGKGPQAANSSNVSR